MFKALHALLRGAHDAGGWAPALAAARAPPVQRSADLLAAYGVLAEVAAAAAAAQAQQGAGGEGGEGVGGEGPDHDQVRGAGWLAGPSASMLGRCPFVAAPGGTAGAGAGASGLGGGPLLLKSNVCVGMGVCAFWEGLLYGATAAAAAAILTYVIRPTS